VDDNDGLDRLLSRKASVLAWIGFPFAYVVALLQYPEYWAIATGVVFVVATGIFTSKVLLGLQNAWPALGMAPIFGTGWLVFLWLLFKLIG
jgi:hypothetical protein